MQDPNMPKSLSEVEIKDIMKGLGIIPEAVDFSDTSSYLIILNKNNSDAIEKINRLQKSLFSVNKLTEKLSIEIKFGDFNNFRQQLTEVCKDLALNYNNPQHQVPVAPKEKILNELELENIMRDRGITHQGIKIEGQSYRITLDKNIMEKLSKIQSTLFSIVRESVTCKTIAIKFENVNEFFKQLVICNSIPQIIEPSPSTILPDTSTLVF